MKKTLCFIIIILIAMSTIVLATGTVTMKLTSDKSTLTAGDVITITFSINSIEGMETGIKAIQGVIEYDTDIFEEITTDSKVDMNGWSIDLNTANNKFAGTTSGATSSGGVFTLALTVKEGVTASGTVVSITDIKTADTSNDDEKIEVDDVSVTIGSTVTTTTNNIIINTSNATGNTNSTNSTTNVNNSDNTQSATNLPKTGISPYIILSIVIVAIVATVSVIRYKNIMK